jgi:hypothetical protein
VASDGPQDVAEGVRQALAAGPEAGARARERVLNEFPLEVRRRGLYEAIEELWSSSQAS